MTTLTDSTTTVEIQAPSGIRPPGDGRYRYFRKPMSGEIVALDEVLGPITEPGGDA
jgi:hypothetical protein